MVENSDIYVKTRYGSDAGHLLCRQEKNVANTPLIENLAGKNLDISVF